MFFKRAKTQRAVAADLPGSSAARRASPDASSRSGPASPGRARRAEARLDAPGSHDPEPALGAVAPAAAGDLAESGGRPVRSTGSSAPRSAAPAAGSELADLPPAQIPRRRKVFNRLVENRLIEKVSFRDYRRKVRRVYDGPQGAILIAFSMLSLHAPLGDRLFRRRKFDLRGCRRILDVGSGAGQIARHLIKYADPEASITCFDISPGMVRRAMKRLATPRPNYIMADLARLPFGDGTFDCITCGYVLEHLPDAHVGLLEMARVMSPGGKMLLLTTEDNFGGAWTSRVWRCRTYNRQELRQVCAEVGLIWKQELWYTAMHKLFRAGGICVELQKPAASSATD
jgi:ubiquinone/menaquinone biosynthesis C-methylase UbiE